jgi:hypothetical protein
MEARLIPTPTSRVARSSRSGSDIDAAKKKTAQDVAALSQQVGTLHAEVIRLDALGARLVQMAGLDRGEFDFSQPPAVGGPLTGRRQRPSEQQPAERSMRCRAPERSFRTARPFDISAHAAGESRQPLVSRSTPWISHFGRRNDPFTGHVAHL